MSETSIRQTHCRQILEALIYRKHITVHGIYLLCKTHKGAARKRELIEAGHVIDNPRYLNRDGQYCVRYILRGINVNDKLYFGQLPEVVRTEALNNKQITKLEK